MKKYLTTLLLALGITASAQTNIQYLTISTGTSGGDSGAVGGAKINTNFWFVQGEIVGLVAAIGTNTTALSSLSNLYGGTMYFDHGDITSDGAGDIFAHYIQSGLYDDGMSYGANGQVPVSNGDGSWTWGAGGGGSLPTNIVETSTRTSVFNTNGFVFTGSNFIGLFTNVIIFTTSAQIPGSGGGLSPNLTLTTTNVMSLDGGTTWEPYAPSAGPVELAVISAGAVTPGVGSVIVDSCDQPTLIGNVLSFYGQSFQVGTPILANDCANKAYVDATVGQFYGHTLQLAPAWGINGTATATNTSINWFINATGSNVFSSTFSSQGFPITSITVDGTGTNILLSYTNSVAAGYQIYTTTNLLNVVWQALPTNYYTLSTNSGIVTATFPMPNLNLSFFTIAIPGAVALNASVPIRMPQLSLNQFTVTHSTNTTWGFGAGLIAVDTNYVYVSVATNAWRRVSIPTTTW